MKVDKLKLKFLGKTLTFYRVLDVAGEVVKVCETEQEAKEWMESN